MATITADGDAIPGTADAVDRDDHDDRDRHGMTTAAIETTIAAAIRLAVQMAGPPLAWRPARRGAAGSRRSADDETAR